MDDVTNAEHRCCYCGGTKEECEQNTDNELAWLINPDPNKLPYQTIQQKQNKPQN